MIRVIIPYHLKTLAKVEGELEFDLAQPVTLGQVLDAVEQRFPVLQGTFRTQDTRKRRPFIRYFANKTDLSHEPASLVLPEEVQCGLEPFLIVGAMAGG